jgi:hypothetical protein
MNAQTSVAASAIPAVAKIARLMKVLRARRLRSLSLASSFMNKLDFTRGS